MIGILIALKKNEDADETKQSGKQKTVRIARAA
ncbi:Elongation factor Ts [Trichinella pseudospiralis]